MERRSRRFRKEARRLGRRLEEEGVSGRIAVDEEAIDALLELHHARWEQRGGSNVGDTARATIVSAARELPPDYRLGIAVLEGPSRGACRRSARTSSGACGARMRSIPSGAQAGLPG